MFLVNRPGICHVLHDDGPEVLTAAARIFPGEHRDVHASVACDCDTRDRASQVVVIVVVEHGLEVRELVFAHEFPGVPFELEHVALRERGLALVVDDGV